MCEFAACNFVYKAKKKSIIHHANMFPENKSLLKSEVY